MGSNVSSAASTPEVCDGVDNDGDASTDEGYDYSRPGGGPPNGTPDCTENVDSDGDSILNPADSDDDNDTYPDITEHELGMDSLKACPSSITHYARPPDTNNNKSVDIIDVLQFKPYILSNLGEPRFNKRFDLNASNTVDIIDVLRMKPDFLTSC